ncbi:hypothetical protein Dform_00440 [Dehalogenimonas formicexedens]|uniref:Uncharacterized protein n=1 Tax=Dehalogenimonas formicexedens TaxID=1839801 RepID=A0A1P8F5N1_9CHLR|nr:hypothetical protein [Dehalogenimonas formicexedens]APV43796.1 hypothetical protein Dform_00440 [Dehalogenimonas formicexedens]
MAIELLWLTTGLVFVVLGYYEWNKSSKKIEHFRQTPRPQREDMHFEVRIMGQDIDQPITDFVEDFNGYLDTLNEANRNERRIASVGFYLAAFTSFLSLVIGKLSI